MRTLKSDFQTEARDVIEKFRHSLNEAIDAIDSSAKQRSIDIASTLDIDTKLAWKISRILDLNDPYSAGLYIPGAAGVRILLRALEARGLAHDVLEPITTAHQAFESLQRRHAGDRRSLDMLLAGIAQEDQERCDLELRKAAFLANTSLWGVRAAVRLMTFVVNHSDSDPSRIDVAHIAGLFAVSRTRPNVPWRVAQLRSENNAGNPAALTSSRPLDPSAPCPGPPLFRDHCAGPVPELVPVAVADDRIEYRLGEGSIGRTSEFDLVFAEFMPSAGGRYRSHEDHQLSVASRNRTPAERLILDLVIARELYGPINPKPVLVSELWGERNPAHNDDPERLPLSERVLELGSGIPAMVHRAVPRHAELMRRLFDTCNWDPAAFDTYRLDMPYPPAPTALRMVVPLPEAPAR